MSNYALRPNERQENPAIFSHFRRLTGGPGLTSLGPMTRLDLIRTKLNASLTPSRLTVVDDSGRHVGHAGAKPGGETHFIVEIASPAFAGLGRVARQRLVYGILAEEFEAGLHALALITLTREEDAQRPV